MKKSPEQMKAKREKRKAERMLNNCSECGDKYSAHDARIIFKKTKNKERFVVSGVKICDSCLEKVTSSPNVVASRSPKFYQK